ncbi:hypothetical protein EMCRGX_G026033 [Ephydatia muelleri]
MFNRCHGNEIIYKSREMKLKLSLQKEPKHSELVSCVGWSSPNELYSVGDDHQILRWDFQSDNANQLVQLPKETYATDIHWIPPGNTAKKQLSPSDLFALACTDGKLLLVSRLGRVEKAVEAHKGAVLGVRWSGDGTALLTYGEDGAIKIWSKTGMLRTILAQTSSPIYSCCWSPDSDQVLYAGGKTLIIKPLQPSSKPTQWKAHDSLILTLDWSPTNNLIISGGEDRKYKVWDSYGRNVYSSLLHDSPIISLAWAPDGELFAVGAFDTLRLCDKTGWSHSLEKAGTGTVLRMAWAGDGTQLAGACANGQVVFAQVVNRHLEWHNLEAHVNEDNTISVKDITNDSKESLEFHDRIVKVSLAWGHLLVTTPLQCYIYNSRNWTTPVTLDLKNGSINLIKQAERHFLIADCMSGVQIISYEGRQLSLIKMAGPNAGPLSDLTVSLTNDTIAIRNQDGKEVHIYDALTGKERTDRTVKHQTEVTSLALSNVGTMAERLLAFMDKNHDLYLTLAHTGSQYSTSPICLGSMVTSICWNSSANMLAAMQDGKFVLWYHPVVVYTDRDLLPQTLLRKERNEFAKNPQLLSFTGNHCSLRRSDGALITTSIPPFPAILHQHASVGKWQLATHLCRFVKDGSLWACLAGMAISSKDLATAEIAYAAINEVHKVQYIQHIRSLSSTDRRSAELALFCHQPQQAEAIYLQSGLTYRAIELNITLFNWERALELAVKYKTHIDTVMAFRQKYLAGIGCQESLKKFVQFTEQLSIDWDKINAKIASEEEKETS